MKTIKVVINKCYGGFGLSEKAYKALGIPWDGYGFYYRDKDKRDDPKLVEVVKKLGKDANGELAELRVVSIPDGTAWEIEEYDGMEWVAEKHRTWG